MKHKCPKNVFLTAGLSGLLLATIFSSARAFAFEHSQVLPAGISRLSVKWVGTEVGNETDGAGGTSPLGAPLERELRFADVFNAESNLLERELAAGFLLATGWNSDESLGSFRANVKGRVQVVAPIYSVGLTDRVTAAVAVPIYSASTNISLGFEASPAAEGFRDNLIGAANNQVEGARTFTSELSSATSQLNETLLKNGYAPLEPWQGSGLGDVQVYVKSSLVNRPYLRFALQAGLVAPTGRVDDPDNFLDVGFGDGQWDTSLQASLDQPLGQSAFVLSHYTVYTAQWADERSVRLRTETEDIEVPREKVRFDIGDKWGFGSALTYGGEQGFLAGFGYAFAQKQKDRYSVAPESKSVLESGTFRRSHTAQFELGYTSIPSFRRGESAVPFEITLGYAHQLASQNERVAHRLELETGVYF